MAGNTETLLQSKDKPEAELVASLFTGLSTDAKQYALIYMDGWRSGATAERQRAAVQNAGAAVQQPM